MKTNENAELKYLKNLCKDLQTELRKQLDVRIELLEEKSRCSLLLDDANARIAKLETLERRQAIENAELKDICKDILSYPSISAPNMIFVRAELQTRLANHFTQKDYIT